jgi:hypothetical protein
MNLARRIMEFPSKSEYDVMRPEDTVNGALGFGPEICDPKILSKHTRVRLGKMDQVSPCHVRLGKPFSWC